MLYKTSNNNLSYFLLNNFFLTCHLVKIRIRIKINKKKLDLIFYFLFLMMYIIPIAAAPNKMGISKPGMAGMAGNSMENS
jgi:hypothetical protein